MASPTLARWAERPVSLSALTTRAGWQEAPTGRPRTNTLSFRGSGAQSTTSAHWADQTATRPGLTGATTWRFLPRLPRQIRWARTFVVSALTSYASAPSGTGRSEEHMSELQSRQYLVCRL